MNGKPNTADGKWTLYSHKDHIIRKCAGGEFQTPIKGELKTKVSNTEKMYPGPELPGFRAQTAKSVARTRATIPPCDIAPDRLAVLFSSLRRQLMHAKHVWLKPAASILKSQTQ